MKPMQHFLYCLCYVPSGHEVSLSHVMAVLKRVKKFREVARAMEYPEEVDSDNADSEDFIGKVATFWVTKNDQWYQLKEILTKCNEWEAVCHVEWLESYNHEGILIGYLSYTLTPYVYIHQACRQGWFNGCEQTTPCFPY